MNEGVLNKLIDDKTKIYISYQKQYFNTQAILKYKDFLLEAASKTGEGYGKVVALFELAAKSVNQPIKDLVIIFFLFKILLKFLFFFTFFILQKRQK